MAKKKKASSQLKHSSAEAVHGLVDYAPDAVVSRTLLANGAGTITLFAFDEGQGLSEHTAPFDAFVQIIDGEGVFKIGKKKVVAKKDDLLIMPAGVPHALDAKKPFKMMLTMLRAAKE